MENEVYELFEIAKDDGQWNAVRLLQAPYDGIVYCYNWVVVPDPKSYNLKFEYDVMENPNLVDEDAEFQNLLGDVLVDIISSEGAEFKTVDSSK